MKKIESKIRNEKWWCGAQIGRRREWIPFVCFADRRGHLPQSG